MSSPSHSHRPRKQFGQNFLKDQTVLEKIIRYIQPQAKQTFLEIGPGQGALTDQLLNLVHQLTVVEIDRDLVAALKIKYLDNEKIHIINQDALAFQLSSITNHAIRIVGNLPYNISTPLLLHFFQQIQLVQDMTFLLQKEVVDRICAEPGNKQYGRLSIISQYYCHCEPLFTVPPEAFYPAPKVQSALVRLTPQDNREAIDISKLELVTRTAFNQRRKTLSNTLKKCIPIGSIKEAGIDPSLRPEQLSLTDFITLSKLLSDSKD